MMLVGFTSALVAQVNDGAASFASVPVLGQQSNTAVQVPSKPNFIMFFADGKACLRYLINIISYLCMPDFGWGDLHSYGHPTQERGRIDEMAEQGIRFTQWYSSESLCTPSRAGLMTGRMPTRMGWDHSVFSPGKSQSLPKDDPTIAEVLKPFGYTSGMSGKWHLGINNHSNTDGVFLPYYRGFDEVGHMLPFSNHWACDESGRHLAKPQSKSCFLYHNTTLVQQPFDHSNLTRTLVSDVTAFIARRADERDRNGVPTPWFYYLPFPQCHVSMFTGTDWSNTSANGIFGDQIREMDWAVGTIRRRRSRIR
jgi:arylsulfatase A-like enzyme